MYDPFHWKVLASGILIGIVSTTLSALLIYRLVSIGSDLPKNEINIPLELVLINMTGDQGGIEKATNWWHRVWEIGQDDPNFDKTGAKPSGEYGPERPGCYGLAWNVKGPGFNRDTVYVLTQKRYLAIDDDGWYVTVCVPDGVSITPEQAGEIQKTWCELNYGHAFRSVVLQSP